MTDSLLELEAESVGHIRFSNALNQLAQNRGSVQSIKDVLLEVSKTPGQALLLRHADKSSIPDHRRAKVLFEIMSFWHSVNPKLTYTTSTSHSERRGELIDFVNAIVGCISDPPGKLIGESIIAAIKLFKMRMDAEMSVLDD